MGTEAAAAHPDAVLIAEDRGDEPVGDSVDRERDDSDSRSVTGSVNSKSGDLGQPGEHVAQHDLLVVDDVVPADLGQRRHRGCEGDGPEQIGSSCLLPVWEVGPCHVVERDGVDGAAPAMVGHPAERVPTSDDRPAAERGVQLVGGQGHEVEVLGVVVGTHVDRPVRRQLGGVDEDSPAGSVHPSRKLVNRRNDAGDVRRTRHDQHRDVTRMARQLTIEVVEIEPAVRCRSDVHSANPRPPR